LKIITEKFNWGESQRIVEATFEEWLEHVFTHDANERDWICSHDIPIWEVDKQVTLGYVERTFRESGGLLQSRSTGQIANGLNYIHNVCHSHVSHLFADTTLPIKLRHSTVAAISHLYLNCFAKKCSRCLSHLDEGPDNPLNHVCYMWWDVFILSGESDTADQRRLNTACLKVMEDALQIDHVACQESALHGLGHWHAHHPDETQRIIQNYLRRNKRVRAELKDYAEAALTGCIQ
jgi:hypothetical protein